jgi:hypothetical protein
MKNILILVTAFVFTFFVVFLQPSDAVYQWIDEKGQIHITDYPKPISEQGESLRDNNKKHSLWKVSSETNTVYLLGSVHLLKQDDYLLDRSIEEAYENSSQLLFEVNLDTTDEQKIQQLVIAKGTYSDARTLKDDLSHKTFEAARKFLSDMGMDIEQFKTFKPWLLAMTLSIGELQRLGYDPKQGVDKFYYEKAKKDGKRVDGLETAEYQLSIFSDMPISVQDALLLQTMKDLQELGRQFPIIIEAWKSGDSEVLSNVLLNSFQEYPGIYKALMVDRNNKWLPKIRTLIGLKENSMVIVGAAHLIGADGIIASLKQKGYRVEQL